MILVDSPGTTDDTRYSDITERYQNELASGFIYVVNSTLAAEEAAKVSINSLFIQIFTHIQNWGTKYCMICKLPSGLVLLDG